LFGEQTSPGAQETAIQQALQEQTKLHVDINRSWTRDDVDQLPVPEHLERDGNCKLVFKMTGGTVPVSMNVPAALVHWRMTHVQSKAA